MSSARKPIPLPPAKPRPISERLYLQLEDMWRQEQTCGGKKKIFGRWFMDRFQPGVSDSEIYYSSHVRHVLKCVLERYVLLGDRK